MAARIQEELMAHLFKDIASDECVGALMAWELWPGGGKIVCYQVQVVGHRLFSDNVVGTPSHSITWYYPDTKNLH